MDLPTKTLHLPYIPALDSYESSDAILNALDVNGSRRTISCTNWEKEFPYKPLATFSAAHSGKAIYIDFLVRCNYLRAENYVNQSPVSQDSCVEVFLQPEARGEYWNFEFNCIGTVNASHRLHRPDPTRLTDDEISRIRRYASCGTRPFRELEGLFTWNLMVVIPLSLMGIAYDGKPVKMRGNFYKCASAASEPHYLSWNPIETEKPDFHRPEFFGNIILD